MLLLTTYDNSFVPCCYHNCHALSTTVVVASFAAAVVAFTVATAAVAVAVVAAAVVFAAVVVAAAVVAAAGVAAASEIIVVKVVDKNVFFLIKTCKKLSFSVPHQPNRSSLR